MMCFHMMDMRDERLPRLLYVPTGAYYRVRLNSLKSNNNNKKNRQQAETSDYPTRQQGEVVKRCVSCQGRITRATDRSWNLECGKRKEGGYFGYQPSPQASLCRSPYPRANGAHVTIQAGPNRLTLVSTTDGIRLPPGPRLMPHTTLKKSRREPPQSPHVPGKSDNLPYRRRAEQHTQHKHTCDRRAPGYASPCHQGRSHIPGQAPLSRQG